MPTDRSDTAYAYWRESAEKFDYLVTGVTGALTAYVGENLNPVRFGPNPQTVEVVALALLVASIVCGFKRIETIVHLNRLQTQQLYAQEARGSSLAATKHPSVINEATGEVYTRQQLQQRAAEFAAAHQKLEPIIANLMVSTTRLYKWRNRFLFAGFGMLVVARILPAYIS